jgi:small-conductance mechanosensitive channel
VVLFLLNRLWDLAPDASVLRRLILLFVTALALAGAIRLIKSWRADRDRKAGGWWRVAMLGIWIAAALLAMSLLVGVLGWSTLAQMLTGATIESAYGAFAWFVLAKALFALARLVPRSGIVNVFRSLPRHKPQFNRIAVFVIAFYAVTRWGDSTLHQFQIYEPIRQKLSSALSTPLTRSGLEISLGSIIMAILILVLTFLLARFVRYLLREEVLPRIHLPAGADHSIVTVVNYAIIAFGILLAAVTAGFNATQLTVVLGSLGVGIGFGLQTVVNNFVSGLILIFERPIKVGDRVQTVDHFGIVTDIGIRASTIRTFDGAEVIVPNGDLVAKEVINWTRSDQVRRVEVPVRLAQGTDPKKVLEILRQLAEAHPRVLATPSEPKAWMTGFGESSLDFQLFAWVRVQDFLIVKSELHVAVTEALQQAGIQIAVPRRDVRSRPS